MAPLHRSLRDYYLNQGKLDLLLEEEKTVVATVVNAKTGNVQFISNADVPDKIKPETFVKGILASCSEPGFTQPVRIFEDMDGHVNQNDLFYDGGVKEFLPLEHAVKLGATSIWAVSTHPMRFNNTPWAGITDPDDVSLLAILKWILDSILNEVERGDLVRGLAYYRLGRAREQLMAFADDHDLAGAKRDRLLKVVDDIFPHIPDNLARLHVITPTRPMTASLNFDPKVMLSYFTNGRLDAQSFFSTAGGPPEFVDDGDYALEFG